MRISDLSSDVCSADLRASRGTRGEQGIRRVSQRGSRADGGDTPRLTAWHLRRTLQAIGSRARRAPAGRRLRKSRLPVQPPALRPDLDTAASRRSEEHTSELQSLMRISYAVFCLKNKKQILKKIDD